MICVKKIEKEELQNSSKLLIIVSAIALFLLVVFFSYSLYGGGKGTYSYAYDAGEEIKKGNTCAVGMDVIGKADVSYKCANGSEGEVQHSNAYSDYYCCPSGYVNAGSEEYPQCVKKNWHYDSDRKNCYQETSYSDYDSCREALNKIKSDNEGKTDYIGVYDWCASSPPRVRLNYDKNYCLKGYVEAEKVETVRECSIKGWVKNKNSSVNYYCCPSGYSYGLYSDYTPVCFKDGYNAVTFDVPACYGSQNSSPGSGNSGSSSDEKCYICNVIR